MQTLTQVELDCLLADQLPAPQVARKLAQLGATETQLTAAIKRWMQGKPLKIVLLDAEQSLCFSHVGGPGDALLSEVLVRCQQQLQQERRLAYLTPGPAELTSAPPLPPATAPTGLLPAGAVPTGLVAVESASGQQADEWLSRDEIAQRAGISKHAVHQFLKKYRFIRRQVPGTNARQYCAPLGFTYPR